VTRAWVLVFSIACGNNTRTPPATERPKDAPLASPQAADASGVAGPDAMSGPSAKEIDEALQALGSEHGASQIRNIEWWRTNAAYVRPHLRTMLEDDKQNLQEDLWAVRILGDLGHADDVALLATVLTTWKSDTARMTAAAALGAHPAPAAGEALIAATNNQNVDTASYAADGLGMRKTDAAARARLEALLDHKVSTMRFHAVNALAELGGSTAALEKRKKIEKDAEVREALEKALKK
jgi:HEAT repeat protein